MIASRYTYVVFRPLPQTTRCRPSHADSHRPIDRNGRGASRECAAMLRRSRRGTQFRLMPCVPVLDGRGIVASDQPLPGACNRQSPQPRQSAGGSILLSPPGGPRNVASRWHARQSGVGQHRGSHPGVQSPGRSIAVPRLQCRAEPPSVGSPRDLTGMFRRRISWDDGTVREALAGGEVAFLMNDCCRDGDDLDARAPSVGRGGQSAAHLSTPCPHGR